MKDIDEFYKSLESEGLVKARIEFRGQHFEFPATSPTREAPKGTGIKKLLFAAIVILIVISGFLILMNKDKVTGRKTDADNDKDVRFQNFFTLAKDSFQKGKLDIAKDYLGIAKSIKETEELKKLEIKINKQIEEKQTLEDSPFGKDLRSKMKNVRKNENGYWEAEFFNHTILVYIPAGHFKMGSANGKQDEKPVHDVYLDGYWIGKYEVTVGQYRNFLEDTGRRPIEEWVSTYSPGDDYPMIGVNWENALAYCRWLSEKTGLNFRLPSEGEWEKAAKGNSVSKYFWGDSVNNACEYANIADMSAKSKFDTWTIINCDDGYIYTASVGSFKSNSYGLHDMAGNVWEWCMDWYDSNFYKNSPAKNPLNLKDGSSRVVRGGAWSDAKNNIYTANRGHLFPYFKDQKKKKIVGFRVKMAHGTFEPDL
jgi:formylglycine-generating enzyme required for sulfatase activity